MAARKSFKVNKSAPATQPEPARGNQRLVGLIGWLLALAAGGAMVFFVIAGQRRQTAVKRELAAEKAAFGQEKRAEIARQEQQLAALNSWHDEGGKRLEDLELAIERLEWSLRRQESRLKRLKTRNALLGKEYEALKIHLGLPYETLPQMVAAYENPALATSAVDLSSYQPAIAEADDATAADAPGVPVPAGVRRPTPPGVQPEIATPLKPTEETIDIDINTSRRRRAEGDDRPGQELTVMVVVTNETSEHDYERLGAKTLLYARHTEERNRYRVMAQKQGRFNLKAREDQEVFNETIETETEGDPWKYEGYAVVVLDGEGEVVDGKTFRRSHKKKLRNFLELEPGDEFNSQIEPLESD